AATSSRRTRSTSGSTTSGRRSSTRSVCGRRRTSSSSTSTSDAGVQALVLSRLRSVPTRLFAATLTFGSMLGVPGLLTLAAAAFFAGELETAGVVCLLLAMLSFVGAVVVLWVLIFSGRGRLRRAEQALYAGDLDGATKDALFVIKTVFRSDNQM